VLTEFTPANLFLHCTECLPGGLGCMISFYVRVPQGLDLKTRVPRSSIARYEITRSETYVYFPFQTGKRNRYAIPVSQIFSLPVEENCRE